MLDETLSQACALTNTQVELFDLVVVGGGYAGLNALYAAVQYLPRGAKVMLIDKRDNVGGMWNNVYDHVRLHQAHAVFTVGDMKWDWKKPARYRARGHEVLAHLAQSVAPIRKKVDLDFRFAHTVVSCEEIAVRDGYRAEVIFHRNGEPHERRKVLANRAIYASGHDNQATSPLSLTSKAVTSIAPQDLSATLSENPRSPVYVVGGGKTGMDTINAVLTHYPDRKVTLLKGSGTNFIKRDQVLPTGLDRWTSGTPISGLLRDMALSFDGDNESALMERFRRLYSTDPTSPNQNMQFGFQSEKEFNQVKYGLTQTLQTHLDDVVDTNSGLTMKLRDGSTAPVADGSIFVNCTGTLFRGDNYQDKITCLSPNDTILTINLLDGFLILSGISAFFMTHLLYRDRLRGRGFYTFDHEIVFRKCRQAWMGTACTQAYLNQCIALQTLPLMLLNKCGMDMDRWYPFPRRLVTIFKMRNFSNSEISYCRRVLDRVGDRFDMHCAPIE